MTDDTGQPPAGRLVRAPRFFPETGDRPDGLELFFDLVFVFCIAQLTSLLRHDPSWSSAGSTVLLFVPVWWTWVGVTFSTDRFPTDDVVERLLVFVAAGAAGAMGIALTNMPEHGAVGFAVGYAIVRVVLIVVYLRASLAVPSTAIQDRWYATGFSITAAIWLISVAVPAPARWVLWALAMVIDIAVPAVTDRRRGLLPVDVRHLPERFGAFVIIVLGESVVTTATEAINLGSLTTGRTLILSVGFVLGVGVWWGFFDRGAWQRRYQRLAGDDSGRLANIVCAYLHFPLVVGIALTAVGVQLAVERAGQPIGSAAALCLAAGSAAYLLTLNVMTIVLGVPRAESLGRLRLILIGALAIVAGIGRGWDSLLFVVCCAVALLIHVGANLMRERRHPVSGTGQPATAVPG